MERLVVVDADALVAFAYPEHKFHNRVNRIVDRLIEQKVTVLFPATAICEAVTVLQRKLEQPQAARFVVNQVKSGIFPLLTIDQELVKAAIDLFKPKIDEPGNTLFDAIIATIAMQRDAKAIFSFDHWYRDIGLLLVEDLFRQRER